MVKNCSVSLLGVSIRASCFRGKSKYVLSLFEKNEIIKQFMFIVA